MLCLQISCLRLFVSRIFVILFDTKTKRTNVLKWVDFRLKIGYNQSESEE